jgi:hypothetical protein
MPSTYKEWIKMEGKSGFRIVIAVIVIAVLAIIGSNLFNSGVSQGYMMAASMRQAVPETNVVPVAPYQQVNPYYATPYQQPWGGYGYSPFGGLLRMAVGFVVFLLVIGLVFGVLRRFAFHRKHWQMRGEQQDFGFMPHGVPPMVAEWHRKMHEEPPAQPGANEQPAQPAE